MIRFRPSLGLLPAAALAALVLQPALAEQPAPPASTTPPPAVTAPLSTTTQPDPSKNPDVSAAPAPTQAVKPQVPDPTPAAPSTKPQAARSTLVETPGDANDVDEVSLPAKPALILSGRAKWEEAVPSLKGSFSKIEAELAKAGIAPTGRPIAVFTRTEDDGFQYEAMIPVGQMPDPKPPETDGFRFGTTPSGKALRFPHKGSYDAIDSTYETLTAYLDVKDVVVQDRFIEEYVSDLSDKPDDTLDVNIYALVK